jgi:hypothetical protein
MVQIDGSVVLILSLSLSLPNVWCLQPRYMEGLGRIVVVVL